MEEREAAQATEHCQQLHRSTPPVRKVKQGGGGRRAFLHRALWTPHPTATRRPPLPVSRPTHLGASPPQELQPPLPHPNNPSVPFPAMRALGKGETREGENLHRWASPRILRTPTSSNSELAAGDAIPRGKAASGRQAGRQARQEEGIAAAARLTPAQLGGGRAPAPLHLRAACRSSQRGAGPVSRQVSAVASAFSAGNLQKLGFFLAAFPRLLCRCPESVECLPRGLRQPASLP